MVVLAFSGLFACGPPQPGDPCAPGSPPVVLDDPTTLLQCTGASGCDPVPEFRWAPVYGGYTSVFCGCDGSTFSSDADYGGPPNYPWREYGTCERGPCEYAYFVPSQGWVGTNEIGGAPPLECTDCARALLRDDEGIGPDGLSMPEDCCRCDLTMLDASGTCVHRDYGFAMPAFCCE